MTELTTTTTGAQQEGAVGAGAAKTSSTPLSSGQLAELYNSPEFAKLKSEKQYLYSHSLYHFVTECLGVNEKATIYVTDPGVRDAVDKFNTLFISWLQARRDARAKGTLAFQTPRKVMYIMSRECMKSAILTAGAPTLLPIWDPQGASLISSYKFDGVATKFGKAVRNHWAAESEDSQLQALFGEFKGNGAWNDNEAVVKCRTKPRNDPTLKVVSVETGGTSGHYDLVILDDPVAQEQVEKYKERWFEKCWEHYKSLGMVTNQDGMFVLVMTRYGEGDLCGLIIEREIETKVRELDLPNAPEGQLPDDFNYETGWQKYAHHAGWDVIYREAWDGDIKSPDPADFTENFPVVWPQARILGEMLKDELFVMAQLKNQPSARADKPLDAFQVLQTWTESDKVPPGAYQDLTIHCDIAWKSGESYIKQKGDYNVIQVWGHEDGQAYLLWGDFGRWTQDEFGDHYADAVRWCRAKRGRRARLATMDRAVGGTAGSVAKFLQGVCSKQGLPSPAIAELNRGGTKKLDRIMGAAAFWADGRVHLVRGVKGAKELADQMANIGYSRYDDLADAAADVFADEVYRVGRRTPIPGQFPELDDRLDWSPSIPSDTDDWDEEPIRIQLGGRVITYPEADSVG